MKLRKLFPIFGSVFAILGLSLLTSCGEEEVGDVTATCKIQRTGIESKTFAKNGVEQCEIVRFTDGDTSTVKTKNSQETYTIRYLSIDTAESTIGYEKWGKAASVWNKSILSKATDLVIEAEKTTPENDSNGTRWLAYVWYKREGDTEYRNYNLECVENGYSLNNCSAQGKYYEYFQKAEAKAKKQKLHIHGDEEDIYYSEKVQAVTIKELNEHPEKYYDKDTEIPACVEFDAYITTWDTASARTLTVEQFDKTDGKYHTYKIFVGYSGPRLYSLSDKGAYFHYRGWTTGEGSLHGCVAQLGKTDGLVSYRYSANYMMNLEGTITAAVLKDGVATFTVLADGVEYTLTLEDSTLDNATVQAFASTTHTIKAFIPNNNKKDQTVGFINTLADIK